MHRRNALASGFTDHRLRKMCEGGSLERIRPGVYTMPGQFDDDRAARHVIAIRAAVAKQRTPAVVSHASAAAMHGLPLWDIDLERVHLTQDGESGGHRSERRHLHRSTLTGDQITAIAGIAVTSVARTVVDVARTVDFARAVAVGDAALNNALTTRDELIAEAMRLRGKHGGGRALTVVHALDHRAESPGESWSRIIMNRDDLPAREMQRVIRADGRFLARVDFYFDRYGIAGEFDGEIKFRGRSNTPNDARSPEEVAWDEKKREDLLREFGLEVMRWTWEDLYQPGRLPDLYAKAVARASGRPAPMIDPPNPNDVYVPRMKLPPVRGLE